jgi:ribokinase
MGKVTVVGSYVLAMVMDADRLPVEGETVVGRNYHTTHGGKGSNMAVCAARLGADTTYLGKIGRDAFGDGFLQLLEEEGVRRHAVLFSDTEPTAVGFIVFSTHGTNLIVINMGANGDFQPADVEAHAEEIRAAEVSLSPGEIPLATALAAAGVACAAGRKYILNPAPAVDLRGQDLGGVFALTPNEGEARVCLGLRPDDPSPDRDIAQALLELGPQNVVMTRGAKGALWVSQSTSRLVPALPVQVLDSVGAGDAFNAGLAVALSEGRPMLEAIALAVTAASLSTERRETIDSYRPRAEVDAHLPNVLQAAELA